MERIYLVASLAIIVTFATLSSAFKSLQQLSQQRGQHPSALSRWVAELKTELHPADAEEAQMLAEMNLPLAATQARLAEQAMQQSLAAAQCARETALREAERARRDAERARQDATRMHRQIAREARIAASPVSFDFRGFDGLDRRIQVKTAAIAQQIAVQNARMQVAAARLQAASMQMQNAGQRRSPCRGRAEVR
jgi:hypothetical protein